MRIDLHCHSTASDGTDTPAELVRNAAAAGLDVVALTDHDTTRGHAEAVAALPEGLTLVTGAELSCRVDGVSMHLLAYLFDPEEPALLAERELVRDDRVPRAKGMIAKLNELGVPVTWEQVARIAGDGSVGRPHIASALVELGVVPTVGDAFTEEWLADGGRAFVEKHETDPFEAVRLVKAAGGVTVFAHPAAAKRGRTVSEARIAELAAAGLDGVEVDHMDHDEPARARLRGLAGELGLLVTGSSDYHGSRKTCVLGEYTTDPEVYGEITRRAFGAFPVPGAGGAGV
ncbi:PHP domain-containing protein [Streptomyces griseoviridis]|uniref:Phosphatase n=3 Tax=Streptomyces TaxID=1883 RepID=A0A918GB86_STRGD|nr:MULTISPECIES: PHP domain-containing protein [Streptomyces]MDP9683931.1 putative metal-dependent phosphoesterase TrpH [Streptomyces griseoviridis]GGS26576.1 phosphatase [Streptomyces niveoruber]GGS85678.1 phosphatase [Streptomyces griseoviridis]GGU40446.1 phosphatase [Streptomyces daghestanicus]GHI31116.1 phosphatase [Streptomyces daghestanicus]